MSSRSRSVSGAALMLLLIPIFAGLLACISVPIGDPEKSRVDPDLSGVWAVLNDEAGSSDSGFYVFDPYDKRTWLITGGALVYGNDLESIEYDLSTYDGFVQMAATEIVDEDNISVQAVQTYKAWTKKLGGQVFMTWEPKLLADAEEDDMVWFVYALSKDGPDKIKLRSVNGESELFKGVKASRRAYEKVIRKNVDNPDLFATYDGLSLSLHRVQPDERDFFADLLEQVISWN
jgi:hypothetical protein